MKRALLALVAAILSVGVVIAVPSSASAGSNNGTLNWYWAKGCSTYGGRMDITNYDISTGSGIWQQYHIDADRAGGVGNAPVIYRGTTQLAYWNDFYQNFSNPWYVYTYKVIFNDGSYCSITG